MAGRREPIYMKRWLSFHFYNAPQQSDFYYLKLCNEIFSMLEEDDFPDEELSLSEVEKKNLACFITSCTLHKSRQFIKLYQSAAFGALEVKVKSRVSLPEIPEMIFLITRFQR